MPSPSQHVGAPLMLSVSGVRGIVGRTMTREVVRRFALALTQHLQQERTGQREMTIVLARDSRPSGEGFMQSAGDVLSDSGCRVIRLGIAATPTVGAAVVHHRADAGLVITASHNPDQWNGLKVLNREGAAPGEDAAGRIIACFERQTDSNATPGPRSGSVIDDAEATVRHVARIAELIDAGAIGGAKLKVVVDSINGAGCEGARRLLDALGVELVHVNNEPSGNFVHPPEPTAENLADLCQAVREHEADVGFAQDPDADRLAVVDEGGRYIGEEYTLVLAAAQVLSNPATTGSSVAVNCSSSRMIDDLAQLHGAEVVRTKVGEANVVSAMKQHDAIIGGEGNGGVIWPLVCHVRDSLSGMALILALMAREARRVSGIVAAMPAYRIHKTKLDLPRRDLAGPVLDALRTRFADERLDDRDGLRIDLDEKRAWLHVRPSNTEPILRLIAEAPTDQAARELIAIAQDEAGRALA